MATDSRATAGNWIASQTVKKVIEINNCLLGTMAGGAAVSSFSSWIRYDQSLFPTHRIASTGLLILECNVDCMNSATSAESQWPPPRKYSQT